jgi:hypothetical protein
MGGSPPTTLLLIKAQAPYLYTCCAVVRTSWLQAVAQCGLAQQASFHAQQAIARALLLLPGEAFVPPARPPLPSPPATPPAPPLPTSQFAWDALGRPYITDGAVVLSSAYCWG